MTTNTKAAVYNRITRRVLYELWIPQPGTIDKMFSSQPPHVQIRNERIYQLVRFLCISASFLLSLLGTKNPIPHHSMKYLLYCCDVYSCSEFRWVMTTALKFDNYHLEEDEEILRQLSGRLNLLSCLQVILRIHSFQFYIRRNCIKLILLENLKRQFTSYFITQMKK